MEFRLQQRRHRANALELETHAEPDREQDGKNAPAVTQRLTPNAFLKTEFLKTVF